MVFLLKALYPHIPFCLRANSSALFISTSLFLPGCLIIRLRIQSNFFSGCTVTREECDRTAAESAGEAVQPVRLQRTFSCTVAAGDLLVQFRVPESLLDTERLGLARKIYGNVVPAGVNRGVMGLSPSLAVYVIDKVPGITYIEAPLATLYCTLW